MKKRLPLILTLAVFLLSTLAFTLIGCNGDNAPKVDYSVTVVDTADDPVSGITVSWMQSGTAKGSAVTDENGKAVASLPSGTYTVALSGYADGLAYTEVTVSAAMNSVRLTLSVAKVTYTATVVDKTGSPAANVTVTWSNETETAGSAVTNESGVAEKELDYGDYTVTVSNLPQDNVFVGGLSASGDAPSVRFELNDGVTQSYKVTLVAEGGLKMSRITVFVYAGNTFITTGLTDENGEFSFNQVAGTYTVRTSKLPDGYTGSPITLTATAREGQMILYSQIIKTAPSADTRYVMGDAFHDYKFTTPYEVDGAKKTYSIAELFESGKKAVFINNWGTQCSYCVREMPAMNAAYEKYADKIELIAVSNYQGGDSDSTIINFHNQYGYSFPMMRDVNGFAARFGIEGWPTTVVIDRYGVVARIEAGAIVEEEVWERLIERYIGDDYVQTFTRGDTESSSINNEVSKPDVVVDADHYEKMAEAINDAESFPVGASVKYSPSDYEYAWPFLYDVVDGVSEHGEKVLYSSNSSKPNSMSVLYASVTVDAGYAFTFDYYCDTEANADMFSFVWDGKIVKRLSGKSDGWQTCYLFADITDGTHSLGMTYIKDNSLSVGKDNVYMRNIRFVPVSEMTGENNMLRAAAYGTPEENADRFPYYAGVAVDEADEYGYYHVNLSSLQNAELAGNDNKPLLFVNLLNATNWSGTSIRNYIYATDEITGEYLVDCKFEIDGVKGDYRNRVIELLQAASASDVQYCIPVDEEVKTILIELIKKIKGALGESPTLTHDKEWLELCYFYSHYGDGKPIGNPIMGLTEKTAIPVGVGTHTADITRIMYPFTVTIYSFTPETDGVYRIESLIPQQQSTQDAAQIWLYDDHSSAEDPLVYCGDSHMTRDGLNEHNFTVYRYMTAGHKYYLALAFQMAGLGTYDYKIELVGDSATVLTPCSDDYYLQVIGPDGNFGGEVILSGAVEYEKDEQGYYHAINPDGTRGGYIYLDVKYPLTVSRGKAIKDLVDMNVVDPKDGKTPLVYKYFDFSKRVLFFENADGSLDYDPEADISELNEKFRDRTADVKALVTQGMANTGDEEGFVKVNDDVVEILLTYIETRNNMMLDGETDTLLDNEWLRFCWYYRQYDAQNI